MSPFIVPLVFGAALIFGHQAPREEVILLPDAEGKVGSVVVKSAAGETVLNQAYATVTVDQQGHLAQQAVDARIVQERFGKELEALPPRPLSFVVYFASGSASELTAESRAVLQDLMKAVAGRPAPELTVIGHTDTVGQSANNDLLSLQRAQTVRELLQKEGFEVKIDIAGRGQRELFVQTGPGVAETLNRRVEINLR